MPARHLGGNCDNAQINSPSNIDDVQLIYDGDSLNLDVSLAGFTPSDSPCPIKKYIITCTDKNGKNRLIRWKNNDPWSLEEISEHSDSDSKCDWLTMNSSGNIQYIRADHTTIQTAPLDYYGVYQFSVKAVMGNNDISSSLV